MFANIFVFDVVVVDPYSGANEHQLQEIALRLNCENSFSACERIAQSERNYTDITRTTVLISQTKTPYFVGFRDGIMSLEIVLL